jgi:hypothetical protein
VDKSRFLCMRSLSVTRLKCKNLKNLEIARKRLLRLTQTDRALAGKRRAALSTWNALYLLRHRRYLLSIKVVKLKFAPA